MEAVRQVEGVEREGVRLLLSHVEWKSVDPDRVPRRCGDPLTVHVQGGLCIRHIRGDATADIHRPVDGLTVGRRHDGGSPLADSGIPQELGPRRPAVGCFEEQGEIAHARMRNVDREQGGCHASRSGWRFDLHTRILARRDVERDPDRGHAGQVDVGFLLQIPESVSVRVSRTRIHREVIEIQGVGRAREPCRVEEADGHLDVRRRLPGGRRKVGGRAPTDIGPGAEGSRGSEHKVRARGPASTRIPTRVVGQDVAEVPDTPVACVQEIEADAGRVRVPRGGNEVLKAVEEDGHVHFRDRRAARREQRVPVRRPEISDFPPRDFDMERSTAGSSEGGRVSGLCETTEVKVREGEPEVTFEVINEPCDGPGSAEQDRGHSDCDDESPRAAQGLPPRNGGRGPRAPSGPESECRLFESTPGMLPFLRAAGESRSATRTRLRHVDRNIDVHKEYNTVILRTGKEMDHDKLRASRSLGRHELGEEQPRKPEGPDRRGRLRPDAELQPGPHPGSVLIDWKKDINDPVTRDIVSKAGLESLLSRLGISNGHQIVLYGDFNNWFAAFAFWVFKYYGVANVVLLNDGRKKWIEQDMPVTKDVPSHPAATFKAKEPDEKLRVYLAYVREAYKQAGKVLVDVRGPKEFSGEILAPPEYPTEHAQRGGHIPGAKNIPWGQAVNEDGTFKTPEELRALYEPKGVTPDKEVIAYCRIGERSSHTWFVLKYLLGYPNVRNYDGSWTEWGNLVRTPIEE